MTLILASASPRRRELLAQLGADFSCDPADIDETRRDDESPVEYVARMAAEKARAVAARHSGASAVLGADTTVVIDTEVLGKPRDKLDGLSILARLSGRTHTVYTAICLVVDDGQHETVVATEEPWDKAGAYGIQGLGGSLVKTIRGSYSNVVGLPLHETWQLLSHCGVDTTLPPTGL